MKIKFYTLGGTIDKIYFDAKSTYEVGDPMVGDILQEANITFEYDVESFLRKDSLDMTDEDRTRLCARIGKDPNRHVVVTHGTDTIIRTGLALLPIRDRVIVLTGAIVPARFKASDAAFNIGCAVVAVQILPPGIYIVMNGRIFQSEKVRKNPARRIFEEI